MLACEALILSHTEGGGEGWVSMSPWSTPTHCGRDPSGKTNSMENGEKQDCGRRLAHGGACDTAAHKCCNCRMWLAPRFESTYIARYPPPWENPGLATWCMDFPRQGKIAANVLRKKQQQWKAIIHDRRSGRIQVAAQKYHRKVTTIHEY